MSTEQPNFEGLVTRPAMGVTGRHYYGLNCSACGEQIAVLRDASEGALPVKIVGITEIEITCPYCRGVSVHAIEDLAAFKHL